MKNLKKDENKIKELINKKVNFIDSSTNIIGDNINLGENVTIYPGVIIQDNVNIGDNVIIQPYTIISNNVNIHKDVFIGPFTFIRDNVSIGTGTSIGPHCEIVRSTLGVNCKIGHRNYIADATLCDSVYFGCGATIANSNFEETFNTIIEEGVKVGANATLIAPIHIGKKSFIAAGSTISKKIPSETLVLVRAETKLKKLK